MSQHTLRIVAFALNPWDGQWMNRQQILSRLARFHRIIYTNGLWRIWDRNLQAHRQSRPWGCFEDRQGVHLDQPPRWLLRWPGRALWEAVVGRLAARRWRAKLDEFGSGPVVAYVFHPSFLEAAQSLKPDLLVYHAYDMFSRAPGWNAELEAAQTRLLQSSHLVIASSEPIRAALQPLTANPVVCVPNGVDAEAFMAGAELAEPADLAPIPHPRLGYVGTLNRKVDFPLIAELATREPTWHFVLLGPRGSLDELTASALQRCADLPNVHILPARPVQQLPACMAALDVGLMCYRKDTWMEYGYPLKLHEYLASGLPVVCTPLESIKDFRGAIEIAEGTDGWHAALSRMLRGETPSTREDRQAVARENTWDIRVERISELLDASWHSLTLPRR